MLANCSIKALNPWRRFRTFSFKFWIYNNAPIWSRLAPSSGESADGWGLKLPLGVLWNVDLQLVCCCCALRRAFSAEGEEGVGQAAAHAASRRKQFGWDVLGWWEMTWTCSADWKQLVSEPKPPTSAVYCVCGQPVASLLENQTLARRIL